MHSIKDVHSAPTSNSIFIEAENSTKYCNSCPSDITEYILRSGTAYQYAKC